MMVSLSLLIFVIFAVFEICTEDSPITPEEQIELAKRISAVDWKRARDAGFSDRSIVKATSSGWTVEEFMRMVDYASADPVSQHEKRTMCDWLYANQNPPKLTSAQEINLNDLHRVRDTHFLSHLDEAPFVRNVMCAYYAQPDSFDADAKSFGSKFLLYMKIRFMKTKVEKASGEERIILVKEMCCLYRGKKDKVIGYVKERPTTGLRDEDLDDFNEQWDAFASTNTSIALENVCDFLNAKITHKECPQYVFMR